MPVDARLSWDDEALDAALRRLPALRAGLAALPRRGPRSLVVTALAVDGAGVDGAGVDGAGVDGAGVEGPGGDGTAAELPAAPLDPADAAVLAEAADEAVLGWADLPEGLRGGFAWAPRPPVLRWLAKLGRERGAELRLVVAHERGDQLYELVRWRFGAGQSLLVEDYDGAERPLRRGEAHRRPPATPEPAFGQLGEALARARRGR